jgi:uncharacterized protein involved in outer membrane biogenesis
MKKILLGIGIVALVLIIGAVVVVGLFLDKIVKTSVETVGPKIVQVPIKLDAVHLSILTGSAKIEGLVVGNPQGYKTPDAISVGLASVSVKPLTILSDKIVVRSIEVRNPEITFEGNPFGKNNLIQIRDNISAPPKESPKPSTTAAPAAKPAKKIEVDDFLITGAKVHFNGITLPLPDIHLTDLGKSENGITAADLTKRVLDAITSATVKAVAKGATDVGKGAENLGKQGVDKLKKGIGGLFGK